MKELSSIREVPQGLPDHLNNGGTFLLAEAKYGTSRSKSRLEDILQVTFIDILPFYGYTLREKQVELAGEVLKAFCSLGLQLAEAEVGIGKTLAYLLPAVLVRRGRANRGKINTMSSINGCEQPVVIATSSIALQQAIAQDYIPAISDILTKHGIIRSPLTSALRKGKANYVCERRLVNFVKHANAQTKSITLPVYNGLDVDLASVKGLTPYIKRNICVDKHCNKDCPLYTKCRYMRHLSIVKRGGYDFQVCNHNYLLADIIHRSRGVEPLLPSYQAVIIDEAHKFLDAAREMYGAKLSLAELGGIIKDIRGFTFGIRQSTAAVMAETDRIQSKIHLLFQLLNNEVGEPADDEEEAQRYPTKITHKSELLIRDLRKTVVSLSIALESRSVTERFESQYTAVKRILQRVRESLESFIQHERLVYWMEEGECSHAVPSTSVFRLNVLCGIPKNLGEMLNDDLWSMKIPVVLTSGTLSAAGSFEHLKRKTGINLVHPRRLSETSKPSPFNHKENTMLYISERVPFPNNKDREYIASVADEVGRLVEASHGHTAVLFTSYKAMDMVWKQINNCRLPYPLFRLDRGGSTAIEQFKRSGNGILYASGAMREGIDIPGDILSMLIIVRLPFAVPDPVSEWEKSLYSGMDEYKRMVIIPEMLVKLK